MSGHLCICGEWHEPTKDARLAAFAEGVAASKNDTAGTRAAARYALTGSLEGAVDEMRRAAAPAEAREEGPVATALALIPDDGLPDRVGEHFRVVTVCGHCGEIWSEVAAIHQQDTDRAAR